MYELCFWINQDEPFTHLYGLKPNSSFNFNTPSNVECHSYFLELFCLYGKEYKVKFINIDKVDLNDINICLIPAQSLPNILTYKSGEITDAVMQSKNIISWCYDNEIKVVIDRSRERCIWNIVERLKYLDEHQLINFNYFRVLVDHPLEITDDIYEKLIIHADLFFWEMGGLLHNYINSSKIEKLNLSASSYLNKKYTFSALMGEIRKPHRLYLRTQLHTDNMLDSAFWSTVNRYADNHVNETYSYEHKRYISTYGEELYKSMIQEKRFDNVNRNSNGKIIPLNNATDRVIPPEFYQCNFNIPFESSVKSYFYTEKTYKPIATKQPFLIFGKNGINSFLTSKGFQIFSEIFDYNSIEYEDIFEFDDNNPEKSYLAMKFKSDQIYVKKFRDEVKRVIKEPNTIWTQKSVINKCKHNSNSLKERTTREKFNDFIIKVFDTW